MAKQKYSDNIITRPRQEEMDEWKEFGDLRKSIMYVDGNIVKGGWYFQGSWFYKASDVPYPEKTHSHDFDEYLGFIGTNPDDPFDLGGEIELYLDGEKYTLTETCIIFIPGGVEHCPVYCRRCDSPIWFMATFPNKTYEKTYTEEK
ncbi:MAG: hypothetical protein JW712_11845 [Dehalococcoidales bacterium]|nr:hypothetical protein [Dehalococcoidales bacterium]